MSRYRKRIADPILRRDLESKGTVLIEGPKGCGKTTTAEQIAKSSVYMDDPETKEQNLTMSELDPGRLLKGDVPRLIDEWQEAPSVWDAVSCKVDETPEKGQFILTGSAAPSHKGTLHSGAGRTARIRMRPMSLYEMGASSGAVSLKSLCAGSLNPSMTDAVSLRELAELIIRGGWPESLGLPFERAALFPGEYLDTMIEDDICRFDGTKRNSDKIRLLLHSLARKESTTASVHALVRDIHDSDGGALEPETIKSYLELLSRLFLIENQLPVSASLRSTVRVKQAPKRHFADPSLACALLRVTPDKLIGDLNTMGFLFEALCERDLRIYAESFHADLYHYQDYRGREIDAVIDLPDGQWCAFEIKLGAFQIDEAAGGLLKIKEEIRREPGGKPPAVLCVICGISNAAYQRPDGVFVVPIACLKD